MTGELSAEQIENLIRRQWHAHLGCHAAGKTYVVPISYAYDGERLIGHTTAGLKIEMMRENPEVCVQIEDIQDMTHWQSVVIWGRFEELTDSAAIQAMGFFIDRHAELLEDSASSLRHGRDVAPPRADSQPSKAIVYCIHVEERTGRFESGGHALTT